MLKAFRNKTSRLTKQRLGYIYLVRTDSGQGLKWCHQRNCNQSPAAATLTKIKRRKKIVHIFFGGGITICRYSLPPMSYCVTTFGYPSPLLLWWRVFWMAPNSFQSLTIFSKSSIKNNGLGSKYASEYYRKFFS